MLTYDDKRRLKILAKDINSTVLAHPNYISMESQQAVQLIYKYGAIFLNEVNNLITETEAK